MDKILRTATLGLRQLVDWVANEEPALGMLFFPQHPLRLWAVGGAFIGHAAREVFATGGEERPQRSVCKAILSLLCKACGGPQCFRSLLAGGDSHQLMQAIVNHALRGRQRETRTLSTLAQATWMVGQH